VASLPRPIHLIALVKTRDTITWPAVSLAVSGVPAEAEAGVRGESLGWHRPRRWYKPPSRGACGQQKAQ